MPLTPCSKLWIKNDGFVIDRGHVLAERVFDGLVVSTIAGSSL